MDNEFKLKTAVLSDSLSFEYSDETIKAKTSKTKDNDSKKEFINEKTVPGIELNFELLKSKKKRIRSVIKKNHSK